MNFSELSFIRPESGFSYDAKALAVIGEKRGYGFTVSDEDEEYILRIYISDPFANGKKAYEALDSACLGLKKNSVNSREAYHDHISLSLCKALFLQEELETLLELTETIADRFFEAGIPPAPAKLPKALPAPKTDEEQRPEIKGFGVSSIKGGIGALIGAAAMAFISAASVEMRSSGALGSVFTELGSYVIPAAAALLIFFDYKFLAKGFDAFGVIFCPVVSVICAVFSALLAAARVYAKEADISVSSAFSALPQLYGLSPEAASLGERFLITGVLVSGAVSVLCCLGYYRKHPEEMVQGGKNGGSK